MVALIAMTSARLKVLVVEPAGLLWGSERALLDLLSHIDARKFEITVACPPNSPFLDRVRHLGIVTIEVPIQLLHMRGLFARLRALFALARVMIRVRPQVVHVNQAGLARLTALAARLVLAPVLCHVRLLEDARRINRRRAQGLLRTRFVCVSDAIVAELARNDGIERSRIDRVYDPLAGTELRRLGAEASRQAIREEFGIGRTTRVVSLIGRICEDKRQRLLLEAAAVLGDDDIHYLLIGGEPPPTFGNRSYRECLTQQIESSPLAQRVTLTGMRDNVPALIVASDVIVLASEEEAFPRVFLEALMLGRHIVGPSAGGPGEIIGKDERGLSFSAGDASDFARCIRLTISDDVTARSRTARGAEWVRRFCAPEHHAGELERIYESLAVAIHAS